MTNLREFSRYVALLSDKFQLMVSRDVSSVTPTTSSFQAAVKAAHRASGVAAIIGNQTPHAPIARLKLAGETSGLVASSLASAAPLQEPRDVCVSSSGGHGCDCGHGQLGHSAPADATATVIMMLHGEGALPQPLRGLEPAIAGQQLSEQVPHTGLPYLPALAPGSCNAAERSLASRSHACNMGDGQQPVSPDPLADHWRKVGRLCCVNAGLGFQVCKSTAQLT
jgi:hypothetical protein